MAAGVPGDRRTGGVGVDHETSGGAHGDVAGEVGIAPGQQTALVYSRGAAVGDAEVGGAADVAHDVLCKSQVQGRRCRHEAREIAHGELEIGARVAEVEHAANHWAIRGGVDAVAVQGELAVHREVADGSGVLVAFTVDMSKRASISVAYLVWSMVTKVDSQLKFMARNQLSLPLSSSLYAVTRPSHPRYDVVNRDR